MNINLRENRLVMHEREPRRQTAELIPMHQQSEIPETTQETKRQRQNIQLISNHLPKTAQLKFQKLSENPVFNERVNKPNFQEQISKINELPENEQTHAWENLALDLMKHPENVYHLEGKDSTEMIRKAQAGIEFNIQATNIGTQARIITNGKRGYIKRRILEDRNRLESQFELNKKEQQELENLRLERELEVNIQRYEEEFQREIQNLNTQFGINDPREILVAGENEYNRYCELYLVLTDYDIREELKNYDKRKTENLMDTAVIESPIFKQELEIRLQARSDPNSPITFTQEEIDTIVINNSDYFSGLPGFSKYIQQINEKRSDINNSNDSKNQVNTQEVIKELVPPNQQEAFQTTIQDNHLKLKRNSDGQLFFHPQGQPDIHIFVSEKGLNVINSANKLETFPFNKADILLQGIEAKQILDSRAQDGVTDQLLSLHKDHQEFINNYQNLSIFWQIAKRRVSDPGQAKQYFLRSMLNLINNIVTNRVNIADLKAIENKIKTFTGEEDTTDIAKAVGELPEFNQYFPPQEKHNNTEGKANRIIPETNNKPLTA